MHLFFSRNRDMASLVLMEDASRMCGLSQRVDRFFPNLLKKTSASLPISPWHEVINGAKYLHCSRPGSKCLSFSASADLRALIGLPLEHGS